MSIRHLRHSRGVLSTGDRLPTPDASGGAEPGRSVLDQRTGEKRTSTSLSDEPPGPSRSRAVDVAVPALCFGVEERPIGRLRQHLRTLTCAALAVGLPAIFVAVSDALASGRPIFIPFWVCSYLPLLLPLVWPRMPDRAWAGTFLGLLYGFGPLSILQYGHQGAGIVLLLSFPVLVTILLGGRAGAFSLLAGAITHTAGERVVAAGLPGSAGRQAEVLRGAGSWWLGPVVLAMGAGLVSAVDRLSQRLAAVLDRNRRLAEDLQDRQARPRARGRDRERWASQLKTLDELGQITPFQLDSDQVLNRLLEAVSGHVPCCSARVFLTDGGGGLELYGSTGTTTAGMEGAGLRVRVGGTSIVRWAAEHQEVRVVSDVKEDAQYNAQLVLPETASVVAVPLVAFSHLVGVLDVQAKARGAFDEADVRFLSILGTWAAEAFESRRRGSVPSLGMGPICRASSRLSTAGTRAEVVDAIIDLVAETTAGTCLVAEFLRNSNGEIDGLVCLKAWRRGSAAPLDPGARLPLSDSPSLAGLLEGTWRIPDLGSDERLPRAARELFVSMGVRALVSFPLTAGFNSFGQVLALYTEPDPLSTRARHLYELLESQAGLALRRAQRFDDACARARLYQDAKRSLDEMLALNAITTTIDQSLPLDEVLRAIIERTLALTGYEVGLISLVDRASGQLDLAVEHGLPEALAQRLRAQGMDHTLCACVFREGGVLTVPDFSQDAPVDVEGLQRMGLRSYLGIPLESRGETVGTLCAFGPAPYSPEPGLVPLLESVGRQVGEAIENARLFEQARRRADRERLVSEVTASMRVLDSETVLKTAAQGIRQAMGLPAVTVRLADRDGDNPL